MNKKEGRDSVGERLERRSKDPRWKGSIYGAPGSEAFASTSTATYKKLREEDAPFERRYTWGQRAVSKFLEAAKGYEAKGDSRLAEANYRMARNVMDSLEGDLSKEISRLHSGRLRRTTGVVSVVFIGLAIFFFQSNITSNVVGNLTNSTSNMFGVISLVVGLIAGFFWLKSRKK